MNGNLSNEFQTLSGIWLGASLVKKHKYYRFMFLYVVIRDTCLNALPNSPNQIISIWFGSCRNLLIT